ncbi:M28 family metallopeptidase [Streptomyces sp. NBC_00015]|uniref:M28 family metallopeptidase n=1 Tax=unclassified Streptomyces TaxID=2593676 RepID=UPI00225AC664|nr:M28 family metallopeptidase [Streptomyces sp. NBC_00103]MCX5370148.1 M28 family metallopeptidase [Streptomyces sp. NBC_00103]
MPFKPSRPAVVAASTLSVLLLTTVGVHAEEPAQAGAAPDLSVSRVMRHLDALQRISDANSGNRAHGTAGYQASVDYVKEKLDAAGFTTSLQEFEFGGKKSWNLIADWPRGGQTGKVLMVGAHLDSVETSPGINDNGSSVAAILETALTVSAKNVTPSQHLRFGFWGTEEETYIGSTHYVNTLPAAELSKITAYLNFDMIGSPNPGYFVYDQSPEVARHFDRYFAAKGIPTEPATALNGRSDHEPFLAKGVPVGGIFTGSAEIKTPEQAAKWGGTAGEAMDKCYHQACDTPANIDRRALDVNSDAVAAMVWKLGVRG